jgi:hypothetical protein
MMLACAGKSIANLAKAIALMTGAGAAGDGGILAGGKKNKGFNKLPLLGAGALAGVGLVLMTSGDTMQTGDRNLTGINPKTGLPYKMPAFGSGIFANGQGIGAQTTNNNITIQVQSADPKAVVDAVVKYQKANGGLPFATSSKGR